MKLGELTDRTLIRAVVEDWVVWRDSGQWERLATTFHPDGWMVATWQTAPASAFIAGCRAAWDNGVKVVHTLAGMSIDLCETRAIAQTKMSIVQRAMVHGVWVDVTCRGRFYDFFEKRDERWAILLRQPIYEYDRLDPLPGKQVLELDPDSLNQFPEGYRHLGYVQSLSGFDVNKDLPGMRGPAVTALYERGRAWLAEAVSPVPRQS